MLNVYRKVRSASPYPTSMWNRALFESLTVHLDPCRGSQVADPALIPVPCQLEMRSRQLRIMWQGQARSLVSAYPEDMTRLKDGLTKSHGTPANLQDCAPLGACSTHDGFLSWGPPT